MRTNEPTPQSYSRAPEPESNAPATMSEPPLAWSDAFCVGHEALDTEHQRLVEAINQVCAAFDANDPAVQIRTCSNTLKIAIAKHLRHESDVLNKIKSGTFGHTQIQNPTPAFLKAMSEAAFEQHIAEHVDFLGHVGAIIAEATRASCSDLKAWFVNHAIKHDSHLKAIFQAM